MRFFERFRGALKKYQDGVHELGAPADPRALASAERTLGARLPEAYREFLAQWNGGYLFHDDYALHGVAGARAELQRLATGPAGLEFGRTPSAALFLDERGRVVAIDADDGTRCVQGSDFPRWLDATMAREAVVYDREGEFRAEAFDGPGLAPAAARKQIEVGLKADPESPGWLAAQAELLLDAGNPRQAVPVFERIVALDPGAAGAWFSLGKLRRANLDHAAAADAFRAAADAEIEPAEAAFDLAHAARAARAEPSHGARDADALAARALAALPSFVDEQRAGAEHLIAQGDLDGAIERLELAAAVAPGDELARSALAGARARRKLAQLR